jgi:hypothetical protein
MRWYRVVIRGRVNGGRPKTIEMTLRAEDAVWAAYNAVGYEWYGSDSIDHDYVRGPGAEGKRVVHFTMTAADAESVFVTEHESFDDMATEITGAAELAALDGHPVLPGMETVDAG